MAGTFAGLVRAWNVATREPVCPPLAGANAGFPRAVCARGDGPETTGFAALCEGLDSLRAWDVTHGVPLGRPVRIGGTLTRAVVRECAGRLLAALVATADGSDETVRVYDATTWQPASPRLETGDEVVTAVALEEHEGKPVVVVRDISLGVQVFDVETGTPWRERRILWHDDSDVVAAGRLDGALLFASAGPSGIIKLRRLDTAAPFGEVMAFENGNVLALSIAGGRLRRGPGRALRRRPAPARPAALDVFARARVPAGFRRSGARRAGELRRSRQAPTAP